MNAFSRGVLLATGGKSLPTSVLLELSNNMPEVYKGIAAVHCAKEVNFEDRDVLFQLWQNLDVKIKVLVVNHWRKQRTITLTSALIHWLTN